MLDYIFYIILLLKHLQDISLEIINTSQDYIHKYKNLKRELYDLNANIYFRESCIRLYILYYITIETPR